MRLPFVVFCCRSNVELIFSCNAVEKVSHEATLDVTRHKRKLSAFFFTVCQSTSNVDT